MTAAKHSAPPWKLKTGMGGPPQAITKQRPGEVEAFICLFIRDGPLRAATHRRMGFLARHRCRGCHRGRASCEQAHSGSSLHVDCGCRGPALLVRPGPPPDAGSVPFRPAYRARHCAVIDHAWHERYHDSHHIRPASVRTCPRAEAVRTVSRRRA